MFIPAEDSTLRQKIIITSQALYIPLEQRVLPETRPFLSLPDLEASKVSIYAVTRDFRLAYFNAAWVTFGLENGGDANVMKSLLGQSVEPQWANIMPERFRATFEQVLNSNEYEYVRPPNIFYMCHSESQHREFSMDVIRLKGDAGLLLVNNLMVEHRHEKEHGEALVPETGDVTPYLDDQGLVVQCANCNKVRNFQDDRWDLVLSLVANALTNTSHGICQDCLSHQLVLNDVEQTWGCR